ncbi:MAG: metallophosphoesterase [Prevotella sp.]|nr:metallophosphoesterase [Prevotella sp.]
MKKAKKIFLLILGILLGAVLLSLGCSKYSLSVSSYSVSSAKLHEAVRIVQLTDLHNSEFGRENRRLVNMVAKQEPDLVLITGDLLNQNEERTDIAEKLISDLCELAPVYVSYGNHELAYEKRYGTDLKELYTKAGATVLNFNWADIVVHGQSIRLGGLYGYCLPLSFLKTGEARENECLYLENFENTEAMKILLCHMPLCWIVNGSLNTWDVS